MKLIVAIVQDEDTNRLLDGLVQAGHSATKVSSTGGFLRRGNSTISIGLEDEQVEEVVSIIKRCCYARTEPSSSPIHVGRGQMRIGKPTEVQVGGAVIFVEPLERLIRI